MVVELDGCIFWLEGCVVDLLVSGEGVMCFWLEEVCVVWGVFFFECLCLSWCGVLLLMGGECWCLVVILKCFCGLVNVVGFDYEVWLLV